MWIDTPLEGILWTLFIVAMFMGLGIESEHKVRQSWLMSLKHPKSVPVNELIAFMEKEVEDCRKKKNRWFWSSWISLAVLVLVHYTSL